MKKYVIGLLILVTGCTAPSTIQAIEAQRSIEAGQDEIFTKLTYNNNVAIYNDLTKCKTPEEFNDVWKRKIALDTYLVQWERLRSLRMMTVDRKLYDDQGILNLEIGKIKKAIEGAR